MPNRLAHETSPYLLQHKDNPVDWFPWGDEAFARAHELDRPILLSVGYSTCHWCHVMERESFEDQDTAALMNDHFVSIKVDREERPDVDSIYMDAVNAMTGRGGWPMTVFMTPDGRPFFAGTYFPDVSRHGMPSFQQVLGAIHEAWSDQRDQLLQQAGQLTETIGRSLPPGEDLAGGTELAGALHHLRHQFDDQHGGLGGAPKFPQEPVLEFLLRIHDAPWAEPALHMLTTTLDHMADGGIYDHLGGGFARYAVDRIWLVPHFEKMLYDNGELARIYTRAFQITGDRRYEQVARQTLDYILTDLTDPSGGFYAAEDADSEGVEGKFYVFTADEFAAAVDAGDHDVAAAYFGVTAPGNFEGTNVLHRARSVSSIANEHGIDDAEAAERIERATESLLRERATRIRPGLDNKVITSWNGLAMRAFALAGMALGDERYLAAARHNAEFILDELRMEDGRLRRTWSPAGPSDIVGFLEDHASYAVALLELYQATGELRWFAAARDLVDALEPQFGGPDGVIFASAADTSRLVVRPTDQQDNPSASGASLAAEAYDLMYRLTGEGRYADAYEQIVRAAAVLIERAPSAVGHLLAVHATARRTVKEVAILGPEAEAWAKRLSAEYRPGVVVAHSATAADDVPLLAGRFNDDGRTHGYVCEQMVCLAPVTSYDDVVAAL